MPKMNNKTDDHIGDYRKVRQRFSVVVYVITVFWLLLALGQWMVVNIVKDIAIAFETREWISAIFFLLSIVLLMVFLFFEGTRFVKYVNWLVAFLIVECVIIGLFALVVRSPWQDLLVWYCVCVVCLFIFVLLGLLLPHDLTLDIVVLFVVSFVFLIISVFLVMMYIIVNIDVAFFMYQFLISLVILMFVMYHAQTINGGRFAEMRTNDYLLATLILFYDFIVIFLLTFYEQYFSMLVSDPSFHWKDVRHQRLQNPSNYSEKALN